MEDGSLIFSDTKLASSLSVTKFREDNVGSKIGKEKY